MAHLVSHFCFMAVPCTAPFFAPFLFYAFHGSAVNCFVFSGEFGVIFFLFSFFALFTAGRELFCFAPLFCTASLCCCF
jgi:hypothetical protein